MEKGSDSSEKDFLNTDLNFKTVHYIEKRVKDGDSIEDVHKDLQKTEKDPEKITKHIDYVSEHRIKMPYHGVLLRMIFIICGVVIFSAIIMSLLFYFY